MVISDVLGHRASKVTSQVTTLLSSAFRHSIVGPISHREQKASRPPDLELARGYRMSYKPSGVILIPFAHQGLLYNL